MIERLKILRDSFAALGLVGDITAAAMLITALVLIFAVASVIGEYFDNKREEKK